MLRLLPLALAGSLVLAPAASARRVSETVFRPHFSATLSYNQIGTAKHPLFSGLHMRIRRNKKIVLERDLGDARTSPAGDLPDGRSIALRNLDRDSRLEVLVDTWTGGKGCCLRSDVFDAITATTYRRVSRNWGRPGYRLRDVDGDHRLEFVTADNRVAGGVVPTAFRAGPLRILHFTGTRFVPVTSAYPTSVSANAAYWKSKLAAATPGDPLVRGYLAAYAGDECLLGEPGTGFAQARKAAGSTFATKLEERLDALGYPVTSAPTG